MGRKHIKPHIPTPEQKMLIKKAGLDPYEWMVRWENDKYLALVEQGFEQRRTARIDLDTMEIKTPKERRRRNGKAKE